MPWKKNENGESTYVLSPFIKDELPTWNEVYNEFYKKQLLEYDMDNPEHKYDIDPYWKIPRRKVLIATVCNQFNKMLYENNAKFSELFQKAIDNTNVPISRGYRHLIRFSIAQYRFHPNCYGIKMERSDLDGFNIYLLPNPSGDANPFLTPQVQSFPGINHVSTEQLTGSWMLTAELLMVTDEDDGMPYFYPMFITKENPLFHKLVDIMIQPFMDYFENGVGWKDENGDLIGDSRTGQTSCITGFDPAL